MLLSCSQRLQRFSTYGHLKQVVLRIIVDEVGLQETRAAAAAAAAAAESASNTAAAAAASVKEGPAAIRGQVATLQVCVCVCVWRPKLTMVANL